MSLFTSRCASYTLIGLAGLIGGTSLTVFTLFLFSGSLNFVDLGLSAPGVLWVDACLSLAFFVQHSGMIRKSFRRLSQTIITEYYQGALYAIASGIVLLLLVILWQESAYALVTIDGVFRWLLRTIFILAIAGMVWGVIALGSFDAFGIHQIAAQLRAKQPARMPFVVRGPYRWVRHPLYFFMLLLIWSYPVLTADRLLFNILWTLWVVIGTLFEERDLVAEFGADYTEYQHKVPMLIPWRLPAK